MAKLKPYILSEDAMAQAEFYTQALGGRIVSVTTHEQAMGTKNEYKDKIMHMCFAIAGDNYIFMADSMEPLKQGNDIALSVEFGPEAEAVKAFTKLSEGGKVKHPLEMQPFGVFYGELVDKYHVTWMITAEMKD
ncbi:VOC family protein [Paenibacillus sp. J2TS4]|uniref:VOC family protein n=1 Tax=Paenibacillus sp. J2TS4 TaxID=2807194 RepID=UPI001B1B71C7|nr:VOC family protein [Paenibacillus sp. J2TS4]GIP33455.1 hypothetical protein J2TS4_26650 [Paenibacillus sp. J2TS4]